MVQGPLVEIILPSLHGPLYIPKAGLKGDFKLYSRRAAWILKHFEDQMVRLKLLRVALSLTSNERQL